MTDSNDFQQLIQVLTVRMDRQEKQQEVTNDLLLRMLAQQEAVFQLQQSFQKGQGGFNERQDQFNIIFLDEIRDIKHEVRDLRREITTSRL